MDDKEWAVCYLLDLLLALGLNSVADRRIATAWYVERMEHD
jgi:hypothetical protein